MRHRNEAIALTKRIPLTKPTPHDRTIRAIRLHSGFTSNTATADSAIANDRFPRLGQAAASVTVLGSLLAARSEIGRTRGHPRSAKRAHAAPIAMPTNGSLHRSFSTATQRSMNLRSVIESSFRNSMPRPNERRNKLKSRRPQHTAATVTRQNRKR